MHGLCKLLAIVLTLVVRDCQFEVFTSVAEMSNVIALEKGLIESLEKYIHLEMQKLDKLKKYMDKYKQENVAAFKDADMYVGNPINAYLLIKRLTIDWRQVELLMNLNNMEIATADLSSYKEHPKFPTVKDLRGTVDAIVRLQETYNLDTALVARGELYGIKHSTELTSSDCVEIGKQCLENRNYNCAYEWLIEADARIIREPENPEKIEERSLILEYMAVSAEKLGSIPLALNIINKILYMLPGHSEALKKKLQYVNNISPKSGFSMKEKYKNLCNEGITLPTEFSSKLKCRYVNNNKNSFLLLAPFKIEELSNEPKIVLYHDVISDNEINVLKEMSTLRFERATVGSNSSGNYHSKDRIGKVAWFSGHDNIHVYNINRRIGDMTGLSLTTAESLQVSNYGVGGHFVMHVDYALDYRNTALTARASGNRIATVLLYMSDDFQGGGTVFTGPKLYIKPQKGSAVFWYNLHSNGDGDINTVHGSCPVLTGSKWIGTKWLYEYGQEFLRPCELNRSSFDTPR